MAHKLPEPEQLIFSIPSVLWFHGNRQNGSGYATTLFTAPGLNQGWPTLVSDILRVEVMKGGSLPSHICRSCRDKEVPNLQSNKKVRTYNKSISQHPLVATEMCLSLHICGVQLVVAPSSA